MNFWIFSGLFFPVIISGMSLLVFNTGQRALKLITAFSGAYLLSISFLHILPEIYTGESILPIGIFVLVGFFIQLFLDYLTKGVEHGHQHIECEKHGHPHSSVSILPIMIGICIHSFLEGMPLADIFKNEGLQTTMLTGIIIHNIPISLVLMGLMLQGGMNCFKSFLLLGIFALSGPVGVISAQFTGTNFDIESTMLFKTAMAMVVGIFLHISTTILFETDEHHHFNFLKFITIVAGAGVAFMM